MASLPAYARELEKFFSGRIRWNCPLAPFSTLKVGGPAEAVLTADSLGELTGLLPWLTARRVPWQVIGRGSNILVADEGIPGVVILLGRDFAKVETVGPAGGLVLVRAGGACALARLVGYCTDQQLSGLEFAVGIPGSVGGAIIMNSGAWGMTISDVLTSVELLLPDGTLRTEPRENLTFAYRQWQDHTGEVVIGATFTLGRGEKERIAETCREYSRQRKERQPQNVASAGSFFKNPPGRAAGKLIEEAGLKGVRIGGAMVSSKHANFIVNTGAATARDILELMQRVRMAVYDKYGIMLEPEVHILGNV